MTIWKYSWPVYQYFCQALMPRGAKLLSIGSQGQSLCVWAVVNPRADRVRRTLLSCQTGVDLIHDDLPFLGTVQVDNNGAPFVSHVFDRGEGGTG